MPGRLSSIRQAPVSLVATATLSVDTTISVPMGFLPYVNSDMIA